MAEDVEAGLREGHTLEELAKTFSGLATNEASAVTAVRLLEHACKLDDQGGAPEEEKVSWLGEDSKPVPKRKKRDNDGESILSESSHKRRSSSVRKSSPGVGGTKASKRNSSYGGVVKKENAAEVCSDAIIPGDIDEKALLSLSSGLMGLNFATALSSSSLASVKEDSSRKGAKGRTALGPRGPPLLNNDANITPQQVGGAKKSVNAEAWMESKEKTGEERASSVVSDLESVLPALRIGPKENEAPLRKKVENVGEKRASCVINDPELINDPEFVLPSLRIGCLDYDGPRKKAKSTDSSKAATTEATEPCEPIRPSSARKNGQPDHPDILQKAVTPVERKRKSQSSKRSRSASAGGSRRKRNNDNRKCYIEMMGINHYQHSGSSDSFGKATKLLHLGKRKRVAQVLLCSECSTVVKKGGVFKAFNACLRRSTKNRRVDDKTQTTMKCTDKPVLSAVGGLEDTKTQGSTQSVDSAAATPKSVAENVKSTAAKKPSTSTGPVQWEIISGGDRSKSVVGCRVRVNQEDSLRSRGWETWIMHPDSTPLQFSKLSQDDILPLLEGMCLSLDKTNRKREASKVTRNRRNLTKTMDHKIDTLTMEWVAPEEQFGGITPETYEHMRIDKSLMDKLRTFCSQRECRARRAGTLPEHILILAIEKGEKGKVVIHFQNLLPEFKPPPQPCLSQVS